MYIIINVYFIIHFLYYIAVDTSLLTAIQCDYLPGFIMNLQYIPYNIDKNREKFMLELLSLHRLFYVLHDKSSRLIECE